MSVRSEWTPDASETADWPSDTMVPKWMSLAESVVTFADSELSPYVGFPASTTATIATIARKDLVIRLPSDASSRPERKLMLRQDFIDFMVTPPYSFLDLLN